MTTLSAKVIRRPEKNRVCDFCEHLITSCEPQLKLYGYAHYGDKPHNLFLHLHCAGEHPEQKTQDALKRFKAMML